MKAKEFKTLSNHPLQSKEWGEFRKAWGNEVIWTKWGMMTLHKIPFTKYKIGMFIKGPAPTQQLLDDLKKLAKERSLIFIKFEPSVAFGDRSKQYALSSKKKDTTIRLLKNNGCVRGKTLFTPTTFWIDLTESEEKLMKSFSSKTRYNIRLAQKHGVSIVEDNSERAFEKYLQLTRETVERQGFYAHTEKYHRLMWEYLHKIPISKSQIPLARLLVAKYNPPAAPERSDGGRGGEIITTWILFVYKDFLYYPYGASSEKYKNIMANNLMMWEAIRLGKKLSLKTFDLWGREPGKGFTKFKEGYNPQVVEFLGTWDLVINKPLYYTYRFAEILRWLILRGKAKIGLVKPTF